MTPHQMVPFEVTVTVAPLGIVVRIVLPALASVRIFNDPLCVATVAVVVAVGVGVSLLEKLRLAVRIYPVLPLYRAAHQVSPRFETITLFPVSISVTVLALSSAGARSTAPPVPTVAHTSPVPGESVAVVSVESPSNVRQDEST